MAATILNNKTPWDGPGIKAVAAKLYRIMFEEDDGLKVDYLASCISAPEFVVERALDVLKSHDHALMTHQARWYVTDMKRHPDKLWDKDISETIPALIPEPIEELKETPVMTNHEASLPLIKEGSVVRRLEAWLRQLTDDSPPVTTKELFVELGTNSGTLNKSVKKLRAEGDPLIVQRIDSHILKCDVKSFWERTKQLPTEDAVPTEIVVADEAPSVPVVAEDTLVKELRGWLIDSRKTADPRESQWVKTLHSIDTVFHEIGVPEMHQSRTDLRELREWLTTKSS